MNVFPSISLETPKMCVETLRIGLVFLRQSIWGVTYLSLLYKWNTNEHFPIYLHGNTITVCWNPQNRAWFSEMINLRDHMPRFTLKMNVFPSICLETPKMCIETLRTGLVLQDDWFEDHMSGFTLKMNVFPSISYGNPINVCWNPQTRAQFSEMMDLRGHMPRLTLKMNVFPSISLVTP